MTLETQGRRGRAVTWGAGTLALAGVLAWGGLVPTGSASTAIPSGAATADWRPGEWGRDNAFSEEGGWYPGDGSAMPDGPWSSTASTTEHVLSRTAQEAADAVTPSVVNIDTVIDYGTAEAAGTGIVLSADGYVLTNHHVVEGATSVTATLVGSARTYTATVVGYDSTSDLAVVKLADATGLTPAELGDSDDVQVGDLVVGVGNAGGDGGEPTSIEGTVTALDQTITATDAMGGDVQTLTGLVQTDAPIQSGQSGGPLVDESGAVVGVDVAASTTGDGSSTGGYAIPIDHAEEVAREIISGSGSDTVHIGGSPFLGVQVSDPGDGLGGQAWGEGPFGTTSQDQGSTTTGDEGLAIVGVVDGSGAQAAGLSAGDTLLQLDGDPLGTADQLGALIGRHAVGDRVTVTWVDADGARHSAIATLGQGPVGD